MDQILQDVVNFKDLKGKIIIDIKVNKENPSIVFYTNEETYALYHCQDPCCLEDSYDFHIEDICGDLNDLLNVPILLAEEVNGEVKVIFNPYYRKSLFNGKNTNITDAADGYETIQEYTFYKLSTIKGSVTIIFNDVSYNNYSLAVSFNKLNIKLGEEFII